MVETHIIGWKEFIRIYMSKRIWVDIDETICFYEGVKRLYKNAIPKYNNIDN